MGKYQTLNTKAITGLTFSHHQGITEVQSSMLAGPILNVIKGRIGLIFYLIKH